MCSLSVIVPSYGRASCLARCLNALLEQQLPAHEIIVVVREGDAQTEGVVNGREFRRDNIKMVTVQELGVVAAMNAGLRASTGEFVALTDDDAVAPADWLQRLRAALLSDQDVGGVGGKDDVFYREVLQVGTAPTVGRLSWFGRVGSGHHLASGPRREVEVLKGVNCAFRSELLRRFGFDRRMRGDGAQVHWELALCLAIRRTGWRLLFDPAIRVAHYPAVRHDNDQRGEFEYTACRDAIHNETLALLEHFRPPRRWLFLLWAYVVGTSGAPGALQVPRLMLARKKHVFARLAATWAGRRQGVKTWCESHT